MTQRLSQSWIWTLAIAILWTAPVSASSITCYGSIVISTLGTDGTAADEAMTTIVPSETAIADVGVVSDADAAATTKPPVADITTTSTTANTSGGQSDPAMASRGAPTSTPTAPSDASAPSSDSDSPVLGDAQIDGPKTEPPSEEIPIPPIDASPIDTVQVPVPAAPPSDDFQTTATPSSEAASEANVARTPEPATFTLLGLAGLGAWLRARRR